MNLWERLVAKSHSRPVPPPQPPFQATNRTRKTVLATHLILADTPKSREKGLLGRDSLPSGEGLWIVPCQAIHMFFMRFPLDLVYIDRRKRVRKVRSNVRPWRISTCFSAHSVLELPAGTIRNTSTQRGDILEISPMPVTASASGEQNDLSPDSQQQAETTSPARVHGPSVPGHDQD